MFSGSTSCIYKSILIQFWVIIYVHRKANRTHESQHEISNNVVCTNSKRSDQPWYMHSLTKAFSSRLSILELQGYWLNIFEVSK